MLRYGLGLGKGIGIESLPKMGQALDLMVNTYPVYVYIPIPYVLLSHQLIKVHLVDSHLA